MRTARFFLSVSLVSFPLWADHIALVGDLNATMARGETRTFTAEMQFNSGNPVHSGEVRLVISAAEGLSLGTTTTDSSLVSCASKSSIVNECVGSGTFTAGQKIRISQPVTVKPDAVSSVPASEVSASGAVRPLNTYLPWLIQPVGIGFSGVAAVPGVITLAEPRPKIIVSRAPEGVVQDSLLLSAETSFEVTNIGDAPGFADATSILAVVPQVIILDAGESQTVRVIVAGLGFPGVRVFRIDLTGNGVDPDTFVLIRVFAGASPSVPAQPRPTSNRTDTSATSGGPNPQGSVGFTNSGAGPAIGLLSSDSPWLLPPDETFRVEPGETKNATFTIDVAKQAKILEPNGGVGSLTGTLTFRYLLPASGKTAGKLTPFQSPGTATTSVTVVSTIKGVVAEAGVPPLSGGHRQLFLAGVGRVVGSVGQFISDVSVFPRASGGESVNFTGSIVDVDMYYMPLGGGTTQKATVGALVPPNVAMFGDIVGSVYGANQQVGSLQIRAPGHTSDHGVGINANVFNVSNPAGTYGTTLPVFRFGLFDCGSRELTKKVYIPGLRKDATGHTNFYVQETCGVAAKVTLDFHAPNGDKIGSTTVDVPPFAAIQLGQATLTEGAVSAVLSHAAGSAGGFVAYATPVDRASGDTWAQVDWPKVREYRNVADTVIIPVAGAVHGANNTYFRTDVAIMSVAPVRSSGTLRFYNRAGGEIDRTITLNPLQTEVINDVTTILFGLTTDNVGYLQFTPNQNAEFVLTSRTYTTVAGGAATFGTAVPTVATDSQESFGFHGDFGPLRQGWTRRIGGFDDAAISTVVAQRPGTFRTNFGMIETKGEAATVEVTLYYTFPAHAAAFNNRATTTYNLAPRQFLLLSNIANTIIGAEARARLGDLRNMMVDFKLTSATGRVIPFITSVDNGTGDSTFRTE